MGNVAKAGEKKIRLNFAKKSGERHQLWEGMGQETFFLDVVEKGWQQHWQLCSQSPQGHGGVWWTFPTSSFRVLAQ